MFAFLRRRFRQFFNKTRTINNEPLNKVSLIVIILVDIFILVNVFLGLNDISRWHVSPAQAYPCYSNWADYRSETAADKDFSVVRSSLSEYNFGSRSSRRETYQQIDEEHLGSVSPICLQYADYQDRLKQSGNQQIITSIDQKQNRIYALDQNNRTIRSQYDSTLLEKIAGQSPEQSINLVGAEKAKQQLDKNNREITTLKAEIADLKQDLLKKSESVAFLAFLKDEPKFKDVEQGYQQASFWYPTVQITFQVCFLLPLIVLALLVHNFAQSRGYGLVALISWHLLVIFFIPLILKIFEFLQFGAIFRIFVDLVSTLLGGLLFLISYLYILFIPLIGFGIIKFFQRFVFNPKLQATNRVQRSQCLKCARQLRRHDVHCPHCGYLQYTECHNCHQPTYKHLPYCKECGAPQETNATLR